VGDGSFQKLLVCLGVGRGTIQATLASVFFLKISERSKREVRRGRAGESERGDGPRERERESSDFVPASRRRIGGPGVCERENENLDKTASRLALALH